VKALMFRHNLVREAVATIGGRANRHAFVSRLAPVRIEDVDELPLPAGDWVRVETAFSGLCGSDVKQILLNGWRDNPLTALVSFPHVLGHEVVGRRTDTGERVVLNPWLSCGPRGIDPPCEACRAGRYPWCRNFRSGDLPVSIHLGNCFEWTPLYFKELHVVGSNGFGVEEVGGVAKHSMEHYFDFVAGGLDLTPVITHRFPLERWDEAVLTLKDARRTGAVKVLLEPAR